jgi:putative Mg2+ transporter-C (MgtC) family protein
VGRLLKCFDIFREMTLFSITVRMLLTTLCGGVIGLEREYKRRPAGFRTHILICLGAAMTTLTGQYLYLTMHYYTDMARLGAQVISGIGFIGAGTIIVTRHQKVKGLTTAAGLWTAAIVGLSLGAGFYEGGIAVTAMVLIAEIFFSRLERLILRTSPEINLYIHYAGVNTMERILFYLRDHHIHILSMQITRPIESQHHTPTVIFLLRLDRRISRDNLLKGLLNLEGIISIDDLTC